MYARAMAGTEQTVFLVDDDPSVLSALGRLLRSAGYTVEAHADPRAFLARAAAPLHGCVVVDLRMPDVGGLELQEELARRGCLLPLVFLTGHGDVPWEASFRMLNTIGYDGPISVEWEDAGMDRLVGAPEALEFVRRLAFDAPSASFDAAFSTR